MMSIIVYCKQALSSIVDIEAWNVALQWQHLLEPEEALSKLQNNISFILSNLKNSSGMHISMARTLQSHQVSERGTTEKTFDRWLNGKEQTEFLKSKERWLKIIYCERGRIARQHEIRA